MRKILSILTAVSLIFTSVIPAFAAETDSKGLEQAILQVKNIVVIPDDYTDFQYSSSQYEENGKSVSVWHLNWNKDDYSAGINASVDESGYLINFNKYDNQQKEGLGTVSRDEGQKIAAEFLAKVRPDVATDMRLAENTDSSGSDWHNYRFKLYKNDVVVSYVEASVEVDKHTGEVTDYYFQGSGEELSKLPATEDVIDVETARTAFLDEINVPLSYYSHYDYNKKLLTIFPAYAGSNTAGTAIDAKTGEAVPLYNGPYFYGGMGDADMKAAAQESAAAGLTREELAAVENISNLLSKEEAERVIRNEVPGITSSMKVTNASLSRNYAEQDKYLWNIGFDDAYGTVNAKTGELVAFYIYTENSRKGGAALSEAKAKEKAESFLKKAAPEKFAQSRFYENPRYIIYKTRPAADITEYSFNYYRQVNGIDFVDNGFSITVNKASGLITQYSCDWYDNVEFPAIDGVISEDEAFDIISETRNFGLMYTKVNDGEPGLVYNFTDTKGNFLIDPVAGAKIGNDGKPYKDKSVPVYSDIGGHWAEATIKKLLENGYYLQGETFNPGQKITQIGFLRYLYSPRQANYDDDEFYKMLINNKIVKEEEKAPASQLTRQDAAKFTVRFLGQGKAAEHPEIFVNPFRDRVPDAYRGYAAICYGLKVMQGDKNERFNGANPVTNAEAATIIYNALQVK